MLEAHVLGFFLYYCQAHTKSTGRHKIGHLFMEELSSSWPWVLLGLLEVLFEQTVVVTCWVTERPVDEDKPTSWQRVQ